MSEGVSEVSERVSAAERASEASSAEQANEWAVQANKRMDKRVAQYFSLYLWFFWPKVRCFINAVLLNWGILFMCRIYSADAEQSQDCVVENKSYSVLSESFEGKVSVLNDENK